MSSAQYREFKHNHYVPAWYQRRFLRPGEGKYWYLDLKPEPKMHDGHRFFSRNPVRWGPSSCFAETDLYTVKWGAFENIDIEKFFFGRVDAVGKAAVEYFSNFQFGEGANEAFHCLMNYMSVQKLRTPKGLGWLTQIPVGRDRNARLLLLQHLQNLFCALWTECVWLIADATQSDTKFIISDHPVTVYNRACFPGSQYCKGFNDPDIGMVATHTYFPLAIDKILILTNLSWVRNPYQSERKLRPNPIMLRSAVINFQNIQTHRALSEEEVLQINYITKRRALRYVAAAEKEWLFPDKHLASTHWKNFGQGLLLMPEPRAIHMGGETIVEYENGRIDTWNEYGHRPSQGDYNNPKRYTVESQTLERFKAEWSVMQGPVFRGTSSYLRRNLDGPHVASDELHQHYVGLARGRNHRR